MQDLTRFPVRPAVPLYLKLAAQLLDLIHMVDEVLPPGIEYAWMHSDKPQFA